MITPVIPIKSYQRGGCEIRTHDGIAPIVALQATALGRYANPPISLTTQQNPYLISRTGIKSALSLF